MDKKFFIGQTVQHRNKPDLGIDVITGLSTTVSHITVEFASYEDEKEIWKIFPENLIEVVEGSEQTPEEKPMR